MVIPQPTQERGTNTAVGLNDGILAESITQRLPVEDQRVKPKNKKKLLQGTPHGLQGKSQRTAACFLISCKRELFDCNSFLNRCASVDFLSSFYQQTSKKLSNCVQVHLRLCIKVLTRSLVLVFNTLNWIYDQFCLLYSVFTVYLQAETKSVNALVVCNILYSRLVGMYVPKNTISCQFAPSW